MLAISFQDIGYFMSPGDRSYDALALMKQLSEHTASAYADALEVLGNETPETILKERCSNDQNVEQENNRAQNNQLENHSQLASHVSVWLAVQNFSQNISILLTSAFASHVAFKEYFE